MKLTAKQEMFVKEYLVDLNASAAYKRAGYKSKNPDVDGHKLLVKPSIQAEIQKAMDKRAEKTEITAEKVLQRLYDTAFSDIKNFLEWRTEKTVVDYEEDGEPITDYHTFITLKEMDEVDGTQISKMKMGKYGIEFERQDPLKALELLGRHLKLFTDKLETEHSGGFTLNIGIPDKEDSDG